MSAMVERCAKAIYEARNGPGCVPWAHRPSGHRNPYRADARAAIEAANVAALQDFVAWVETWVSNPVGAYSVMALDGLFAITRDKIAAIEPSPETSTSTSDTITNSIAGKTP